MLIPGIYFAYYIFQFQTANLNIKVTINRHVNYKKNVPTFA